MSERKKAKREETTGVITVNNASSEGQQWFPLENSPSVMNSLLARIGFDTSLYRFTNVLSIEPWALRMIPQPFLLWWCFTKSQIFKKSIIEMNKLLLSQIMLVHTGACWIYMQDYCTTAHDLECTGGSENCCHLSRLMATFLLRGLSSGHAS